MYKLGRELYYSKNGDFEKLPNENKNVKQFSPFTNLKKKILQRVTFGKYQQIEISKK